MTLPWTRNLLLDTSFIIFNPICCDLSATVLDGVPRCSLACYIELGITVSETYACNNSENRKAWQSRGLAYRMISSLGMDTTDWQAAKALATSFEDIVSNTYSPDSIQMPSILVSTTPAHLPPPPPNCY